MFNREGSYIEKGPLRIFFLKNEYINREYQNDFFIIKTKKTFLMLVKTKKCGKIKEYRRLWR